MSLDNKNVAVAKFNIKDYMQLIETVVKVEIKKFNVPHLIEYSELVNIGIQVIHTLAKSSNMEAFNSSYLSTAIKWAIRNEVRRRYKWYTLKTKNVKLDEENQNESDESDQYSGIENTSFRSGERFPSGQNNTAVPAGNFRNRPQNRTSPYSQTTVMTQFPGRDLSVGGQDSVRQEVVR